MILGIGSDLANIERIEKTIARFGDRFLDRVFTDPGDIGEIGLGHMDILPSGIIQNRTDMPLIGEGERPWRGWIG